MLFTYILVKCHVPLDYYFNRVLVLVKATENHSHTQNLADRSIETLLFCLPSYGMANFSTGFFLCSYFPKSVTLVVCIFVFSCLYETINNFKLVIKDNELTCQSEMGKSFLFMLFSLLCKLAQGNRNDI